MGINCFGYRNICFKSKHRHVDFTNFHAIKRQVRGQHSIFNASDENLITLLHLQITFPENVSIE